MTPTEVFFQHPIRNGAAILLTFLILLSIVLVALTSWGIL